MQLAQLQQAFSDAIFADGTDAKAVAELSKVVRGCKALSTEALIDIYRKSIFGGLIQALGEIHPVCKQLVGEEFFNAMAHRYALQTPSRAADLAEYGESFSDFIAQYPAASELPYLADMARTEWLWHRSFHAADSAAFDLTALATLSAEDQARLQLHVAPSLFLTHSPYPVQKIWALHQSDSEDAEPISLDEGGGDLVIWRDEDYQVYIEPTDADTAEFLKALQANPLLESALLQHSNPEAAATVLPTLVSRGWLCGFSLAEPTSGD